MIRPVQPPPLVAIIGGGFTGATAAYHLARALPAGAMRIVVIEPRAGLGEGLAYSTTDPAHRINVAATRITMDCAEPGQFAAWLERERITLSEGTRAPSGTLYPQRNLVGRYIRSMMGPLLADGRIVHLRAKALGVTPEDGRYRIQLDSGPALQADRIVLATSHPPPGVPAAFEALKDSPHVIANPSDPTRIARVAQEAREVLIVGTGLTSADVIASLDRQGFCAHITALSRRGLRSRGHAFNYEPTKADFATTPETTALGVLRRIRRAVRADAALGLPWQATLDRVRIDGPAIWAALPASERARLVRRLRVWWDVHRFRIAPQPEAVIERRTADGTLQVLAANLISAREAEGGIEVTWRARRAGALNHRIFDAVILTTGPAHEGVIASSPLMASLSQAGLIRPDALGLGLDVQDGCRAVTKDGQIAPGIFVAGPLARGHIGELMGIPEVTAHAEMVAAMLLGDPGLRRGRNAPRPAEQLNRMPGELGATFSESIGHN